MKKMKKMFVLALSLICIAGMATGCSTSNSMSYTFSVDNGDSVKVELDTTDGYKMTSDIPFAISKGEDALSQGIFMQGEVYDQYADVISKDESAEILDSGTKDGNDYIFWCYNGQEYNYAMKIAASNTGMILGNIVSEESARECFDRLTVTVAE